MRLNRANSLLFAGLLYAGGLVVISVSPITEWRFIPEMPWEYLLRGWPKYWTGLDVLLNVLDLLIEEEFILLGQVIQVDLIGQIQNLLGIEWRRPLIFFLLL